MKWLPSAFFHRDSYIYQAASLISKLCFPFQPDQSPMPRHFNVKMGFPFSMPERLTSRQISAEVPA